MTDYSDYSSQYFTNPDGLQQFYRDYNTAPAGAPTVLCMPGLTRNSKDFADIAEIMAAKCRIICVEQRGRGLSEWDPNPKRYRPDVYVADMMALLAHLNIPSVIACGTSLGGLMTIMIAAMHPGTIKAAIINDIGPEIDPAGIKRIASYVGKGTPPKNWSQAIAGVKSANTGVYPTFTDDDWRDFTHKLYVDVNGIPTVQYDPAISQNFEKGSEQSSPNLWAVFEALYSVPVVVLRGALSDILSSETLARMATSHPDLIPITVADKGHVPLMTEPECLRAIDDLLKKYI